MTTINPNDILFSVPTLSNELASLLPVTAQPTETDFLLHEDEWEQVEFFPGNRLEEIQAMLAEYKSFEATHRTEAGWRKAYVRDLKRSSVLDTDVPTLATLLGCSIGPAPMLYYGNTLSGQVQNGFSLALGGNVSLYGFADDHGIPVLAVSMGPQAENARLMEAFAKLNASHGLIMVDWRSQLLVRAVNAAGQMDVWRA
ncbi:hypothetical protein [Undibacterium sp. TJN19]|uniref:hypothetical protein n=1 Tax=Undibacterium sp. TJN19 TaxID=3413055 RepID=UPI003BF35649